MALRRFTDGIGSVAASNPLGQFPYLDPTKYAVFFDDFLHYDVTQLIGSYPYVFTQTNCVDTILGATGVLTLTLAGGDNDLGELHLTEAPFQLSSIKKFFFEARVKIDKGSTGTIGEQEFYVGMSSLQTGTNFMAADGLSRAYDDGIGFISYDGSTSIDCLQGENDVFSTNAAATTYADVTWMVLSIYSDGVTSSFYKDDVLLGTLTGTPPTSVVSPKLFFKGGEAKAGVVSLDYWIAALER